MRGAVAPVCWPVGERWLQLVKLNVEDVKMIDQVKQERVLDDPEGR